MNVVTIKNLWSFNKISAGHTYVQFVTLLKRIKPILQSTDFWQSTQGKSAYTAGSTLQVKKSVAAWLPMKVSNEYRMSWTSGCISSRTREKLSYFEFSTVFGSANKITEM